MKKETSKRWDKRYKKGWHSNKKPLSVLTKWVSKIRKGKSLDIACGLGINSMYLTKHGFDVDSIDLSQKAIKSAQKKSRKNNLDVNWINDDFYEIKLPIKYYNLVISANFYLKNQFKRIARSLKRNCYFIYHHHLKKNNINKEKVSGPPNKFRFEEKEIKSCLSDFDIKEFSKNITESLAVFDLVAKKK